MNWSESQGRQGEQLFVFSVRQEKMVKGDGIPERCLHPTPAFSVWKVNKDGSWGPGHWFLVSFSSLFSSSENHTPKYQCRRLKEQRHTPLSRNLQPKMRLMHLLIHSVRTHLEPHIFKRLWKAVSYGKKTYRNSIQKNTYKMWVLTLPSGIMQSSPVRKRGRGRGICEFLDGEGHPPISLYKGGYVDLAMER